MIQYLKQFVVRREIYTMRSYDETDRYVPAPPLRTDRNGIKFFLLAILTLGIYGCIFFISLSFDINKIASRHDGKKTMNYLFAAILAFFTFSIIMLFWHHSFTVRIRNELKRRKIGYKFGPSTFWLWNCLGSFIIVGPIIYAVKLCKAMNLLCEDYNKEMTAAMVH